MCIYLKFDSNEFHKRIVDGKNDLKNVSKRLLVPYIVKNFLHYNCYHLNIHLDSRVNIEELYCYEFYENNEVSFRRLRLQLKASQPVSKYKDFFLANFGNPIIIRAASSWSFSNFLASFEQHPSHKVLTCIL